MSAPDRHTPLWYALRTRSRSERIAGERLEAKGLEVFTATAAVARSWSDRVKRVETPLFPGYIFARFALDEAAGALSVPGVVEVVRCAGCAAPIRPEELDAVRRLAEGVDESGELPETADVLEPGLPVKVTAGPFRGLLGVLLHRDGSDRVAVKIQALRQARAVRMERSLVVPLPSAGCGLLGHQRQVALAS